MHVSMDFALLVLAPAILFLPFVSFAILMTAGRWSEKWWHRAPLFSIPAVAIGLLCSVFVALAVAGAGHGGHSAVGDRSVVWAPMGNSSLSMGFRIDGLTVVMLFVVTIVALMVQIYSIGYMHGDKRYSRFFAYLSLFTGAMLGLVLANNLLQLYIFWELVGLSSYLLIGFWFEKPEAMRAAKKAFIVTRLGDVGFFLGLLLLYSRTDTLHFQGIFDQLHQIVPLAPAVFTTIALLLFCGAIGKSAQFPLHVWLPDAMEGPTPVSALIHAATMVAAGVYLVGRMYPLFEAASAQVMFLGMTVAANPLRFVAGIGAITALLGATIGLLQNDIKRVLAYSTISQLGYMMVGLGVGGVFVGLFHLMTHAFFKALLFLGSGSVILGMHHKQDMTEMGGLWKKMKVTFVTFLIGTLSLAGLPFLTSGFYSKEEILGSALHASTPIFAAVLAGAFLTSFYMMRLMILTFFGQPRSHAAEHAHESPLNMTVPLCILAALSIGWWKFLMGPLHHFMAPGEHAGKHEAMAAILGVSAGVLGLVLGGVFYGVPAMAGFRRAVINAPVLGTRFLPWLAAPGKAACDGVAAVLARPMAWWLLPVVWLVLAVPMLLARLIRWLGNAGGVYAWIRNKYYFDEIYWAVIVIPLVITTKAAYAIDRYLVDMLVNAVGVLTRILAEIQGAVDKYVVDGLVNGAGWFTGRVGQGFRHVQTGLVQNYALVAVLGLVVVTGLYLYLGF